MDQHGTLVIVCFVALWNNESQGRAVVMARIRTTQSKAEAVFRAWLINNKHLATKEQYNSPFEASFQPDHVRIEAPQI